MKKFILGLVVSVAVMFGIMPIVAQAYEVGETLVVKAYCNATHTTIDQLKAITAALVEDGEAEYARMLEDTDNRCYDASHPLHFMSGVRPISITLTKRLWGFSVDTGDPTRRDLVMWEMKDTNDQVGYTWLIPNKTQPGDA